MSCRYAIASPEEACAYLEHPVLGPRLVECAEALLAHAGKPAEAILGSVDATKLRSSMTLFARAAELASPQTTGTIPVSRGLGDSGVFTLVLERFYEGRPDPATERLL
jgi:uncharacterized protein (DUF1810 family)